MSKLLKRSFKWAGVDCDYDRYTTCEESGCDYICRCSKIINQRVCDVDISVISSEIYAEFFDDSLSTKRDNKINSVLFGISKEIDLYTIDRILRNFKIWDSDNWEVDIDGGYYGEELGDICLEYHISKRLEDEIELALSIDDINSRIEYLLKLEYGYLLPELKGRSYEVVTLNKEDIVFGSVNQYKKVSNENLDHYSDKKYTGIRGVVMEDGKKFKIIDGYHRLFKTDLDKVLVLKAKK